ncbi:MAG: two pore domain potassium channel family protein [Bacteroidales bacterium]|nr:two pore domain potassium channel family protein [Bacteroidales bacterium]
MYPNNFYTFKVRLKDKPFKTLDGNEYIQTASISFFNEYGQEIAYCELGYIAIDEIYKKIYNHEALCLDYVYVENFSILDYKNKYQINDEESVEIFNFSAKSAVFYANNATIFNGIIFKEKPVTFENALFIKGITSFDNVMFEEGNVNFNSAIFFNGNVSFYNTNFLKGTINFKNTTWGIGNKNFQYTYWGNGDILFSNSLFKDGNISFVNCSFGDGELSFKVCSFGKGNIDFRFAVFGDGNLNFERTELGDGLIDFSKTEFGKAKVNFNKAIIGKAELNFDEIQMIEGKWLFKQVYMEEGSIHFDEAELKKAQIFFNRSIFKQVNISFYKSSLSVLSFEACQLNSYCDLRLLHCNFLNLSGAFIRDIVDISLEENPKSIDSLYVFGTRLMGRIFLSWKNNGVQEMIHKSTENKYEKAWQYNLLKQNFNTIGQYDDEDLAYVAFKREELALKKEQIQFEKWYKRLTKQFLLSFQNLVFDKMGLYATSPLRVFYSIIILWFFFGLLFSFLHYVGVGKTWSSVGNPDHISIFAQSFYHSAITFFTIGYGDVFPQGLSRILSSIEGFVGVFMMSYFTVAFVRKVLR